MTNRRSIACLYPILLFALCSLPANAQTAGTVSIDALAKDATAGSMTVDKFMDRFRDAEFHWVAVHETARSVAPDVTFAGMRAWETIARFESNTLCEVAISLYNRGDAGNLTNEAFDALVAAVQSNLTEFAGSRPKTPREMQGTANGKVMRASWSMAGCRMDVEWSFTPNRRQNGISYPFRAEYIRVVLAPTRRNGPVAASASAPPARINVLDLRAHVFKDDKGDVFITGVPMVDQGEKGYCAAAVTERVMRYFGQDIDQHKVAQLADTTSAMGTSPDSLVKALRRIASRLELNVKTYDDFTYDDFARMIKEYNHLAVKSDAPQVQIGNFLIVTDVYDMLDTELLEQTRMKRGSDMQRFVAAIHDNVDSGVPLLWAVILGKVDENPPLHLKGSAGHVRLILGYNPKQQYVIYSDTWGVGHERKYMTVEEAWAITTGLYTMRPQSLH